MANPIGAETAKLAGLQTDMLQKVRDGQLTLDQFEWWLNQGSGVRDRHMQPDFRDVVRGVSRIVAIEHLIDCDAEPFCPYGWKVETHKKGGKFVWAPDKVRLHLSPNQQNGKFIVGNELRKELAKEPVFNANVLDYLLAHTELIPEEWKNKYIYFWGTVYRRSDGDLCVRCLCWGGEQWFWGDDWLVVDFNDCCPAACSQVSS